MKKLTHPFFIFTAITASINLAVAEPFIEWAPFTALEGVTQEQVLAASQEFQTNFLSQQKGFLKRELLHEKGQKWIDLVYWENEASAKKVLKVAETSPSCAKYFSIMHFSDYTNPAEGVKHFNLRGSWTK